MDSAKHMDKIRKERARGVRRTSRCGYDVIDDVFFAEEEKLNGANKRWEHQECQVFADFSSLYTYLDGNVFDHACYYKLAPDRLPHDVDKEQIYRRHSFIEYTIDDTTLYPTHEEQIRYAQVEKARVHTEGQPSRCEECTRS